MEEEQQVNQQPNAGDQQAGADTQAQQPQTPPPNVVVHNTGNSIQVTTMPETLEEGTDPSTPETAGDTDPQPQPDTPEATQQHIDSQMKAESDLKDDLKTKGIDFNSLAAEFDTNGELSQASLDALDKAGYPKSVVDAYINGMQANVEKFVTQVHGFAGGPKEYAQLTQFMQTLPVSMRESFNATINTGNLGQIQLAINGIKAQMVAKYGTTNPTVMSGGNVGPSTSGFTTTQEMVKAMNDPRYQTDMKYTREVIMKVQNAAFYKR